MYVLLGLLLLVLPAAQTPRPAAIRVSGHVIDDDSKQPLEGVIVTLSPRLLGKRERTPPAPTTVTKRDGAFSFDVVGLESFQLSAERKGYRSHPGAYHRVWTLAGADPIHAIVLGLIGSGSLTGTIVDDRGHALPGFQTAALRRTVDGAGLVTTAMAGFSSSDANGIFRFESLDPGGYVLAANPPTRREPEPAQWVRTYFPATSILAEAQPVAVTAGKTTAGIELRVVTGPSYQVSGAVVAPDGAPMSGILIGLVGTVRNGGGPALAITKTSSDGTFRILGAGPDTFQFRALIEPGETWNATTTPESVTVTDSNVVGLRIVVQRR